MKTINPFAELLAAFVLVFAFGVVCGCAKDYEVATAEAQVGRKYKLGNVSSEVTFNTYDYLFYEQIYKIDLVERKASGSDILLNEFTNETIPAWTPEYLYRGKGETGDASLLLWNYFTDSAWAKRKSALLTGRCKFSYDITSLWRFDGVSALIYNTSYLFSVPRKALTAVLCMDGLQGYLESLIILIIGACASIISLVAGTIVCFICHPIETLANLTVGLFCLDNGYWTYVLHTNLLASLWDLIWGAIIYPILQIFVFWM